MLSFPNFVQSQLLDSGIPLERTVNAMPSILVLTASRTICAAQLTDLPTLDGVQLREITVATNSGNFTVEDVSGSRFETVVSSGPSGHHSLALLSALATVLTPNGKLILLPEDGSSNTTADALKKNLILSGFINTEDLSIDGAAAFGVVSYKPKWETGAKAAITFKPKSTTQNTWTLAPDDGEDDELVDEDELLTAEDLQRPAPATDDCEVGGGGGGRKACDNCSCGRADGGEVPKLTQEMIENPTSGCGSCSLGDAFRCGGCPYRGLPAFEMGKKIELPADFLLADM